MSTTTLEEIVDKGGTVMLPVWYFGYLKQKKQINDFQYRLSGIPTYHISSKSTLLYVILTYLH